MKQNIFVCTDLGKFNFLENNWESFVLSVSISNTFIFLVTDINSLVCRLQVKEKPHSKEDLAALDGPSTGLKLLAFQFCESICCL